MEIKTDIRLGDSRQVLKQLPDQSVDLIFTSPPYADQRRSTYGGIHPMNMLSGFYLLPVNCIGC